MIINVFDVKYDCVWLISVALIMYISLSVICSLTQVICL